MTRTITARPKMPTKAVGPACPECGSIASNSLLRGWSEPDDDYLRQRKCRGCGVRFVTVEIVLPQGQTSFYRLDYRGRERRRKYWRRHYAKTSVQRPTQHSDRLSIKVKVTRNPALDRLTTCIRGHPFTAENTYVYPDSGARSCRLCRQIRQRHYYLRDRRYLAATTSSKNAAA